jgi:two-component system chemotaxis response regulator CheB
MSQRDIVVIGASAGGQRALSLLVKELPKEFAGAVFIVMHVSPHYHSLLPAILSKTASMAVRHAVDGEPIRSGRIYVAPPDHHMVLETDRVRLTKGPKENRSRPAVDCLFRSAAYYYGPRVVGVVLTGTLDDGTAGLWSIKDRSGVTIIQDPEEAEHPSMPLNAKQNVQIDYCLPIGGIAQTLARLTTESNGAAAVYPMADQLEIETRIALENNPLSGGILKLGQPSIFTCPSCHGALVEIKNGDLVRFRCHTGHSFSVQSLLADLNANTENTLWSAVRSVDEKIMLLDHLARHARDADQADAVKLLAREVDEAKRQLDLLRRAALSQGAVKADQLDE